jgi:hypothetical protein
MTIGRMNWSYDLNFRMRSASLAGPVPHVLMQVSNLQGIWIFCRRIWKLDSARLDAEVFVRAGRIPPMAPISCAFRTLLRRGGQCGRVPTRIMRLQTPPGRYAIRFSIIQLYFFHIPLMSTLCKICIKMHEMSTTIFNSKSLRRQISKYIYTH